MRFTNYTSVKCTMTVSGAVFQRETPDWLDAEYLIVKSSIDLLSLNQLTVKCENAISWNMRFLGLFTMCFVYILCLTHVSRCPRSWLESNFFSCFPSEFLKFNILIFCTVTNHFWNYFIYNFAENFSVKPLNGKLYLLPIWGKK